MALLTEKLLLHILIFLAPVFLLSIVYEGKDFRKMPIVHGVLQGVAAFTCMIFAYYNVGLYWDLRYVPLVLATLYGGPLSGGIVVLFIFAARIYNGGDALLFGFISIIVASILPFLFSNRFMKISARKRIISAICIGTWPAVTMLCILLSYMVINQMPFISIVDQLRDILLFGGLVVVGTGMAAKFYELLIERQQMKEEMLRAEKMNTMGELASSIAHEVRNPLTVVKGFVQLLEKNNSQKDHDYYSLIFSEIGKAEGIISDYLNFAKPQFDKIERLHAGDILEEVVSLMTPIAIAEGVEVYIETCEETYVYTDKDKLKQVCVNLIKNSIEASSIGGKVLIGCQSTLNEVEITIKDEGKGMTQEQLERIGTLFYTTKDKGTGIGTMVTLRIVQSMNGKVTYTSEPGKGTTVTVRIPNVA
ncbi:sensor histidine kinase [Bacillus coahuilensis]|uniref:ATP-binding protein n=1 Tax=Bacillus coahuilensis TaxID=408580 RepID=UPI000ACBCD48|nr:sensor histidine kinase [Bacillus coahuilensis]